MDMRLELVLLPVTDIDRAKGFYANQLGFNVDVDHNAGNFRVVQLTPPGSSCSISMVEGEAVSDAGGAINDAAPGSLRGLHLVVDDIEATRKDLTSRGVEVSEPFHFEAGKRAPGRDPTHADYGSFADFSDPDGNTWVLQEVPSRA